MGASVITLHNSIHWSRAAGDKVQLPTARIVIEHFAFATRDVFIRFENGPDLDFTLEDMDNLVNEYRELRAKCPIQPAEWQRAGDFVVPKRSTESLPPKRRARSTKQKLCARCKKGSDYPGDWYGDLCPECADQTDGDWVCRRCGRKGGFEEMGGRGTKNPKCCGVRCTRIDPDADVD